MGFPQEQEFAEQNSKRGNEKDTKNWCRGIYGRDHKYDWKETRWGRMLTCTSCGRIGDYWFRAECNLQQEIKKRRKAAKLSQEALGQMCGMEQSRIATVEGYKGWHKQSEPTLDTYRKILDALGCQLLVVVVEKK